MLRNVVPLIASSLPSAVVVGGRRYPLVVRRVRNARRIRLRIDPLRDRVLVTLPPRATEQRAMRFWFEKEQWVRDGLAKLPPRIPLTFGDRIPVLGETLTIVSGARSTRLKHPLPILATPSKCEETVKRLLVQRLQKYIEPRARRLATRIGAEIKAIAIRDTTTCWGSCTRDGRLMFSWRLVFAPKHVLDYLIAHEVAHLKELHHGPEFWELNARLHPDVESARAWLSDHGSGLYRYGSR